MAKYPKTTGCAWPPHKLQVLACVLLGSQALVSGLCLGPLFPRDYAVVFGTSSCALQLLVIGLGVWAMLTDPTDPTVYLHREKVKTG